MKFNLKVLVYFKQQVPFVDDESGMGCRMLLLRQDGQHRPYNSRHQVSVKKRWIRERRRDHHQHCKHADRRQRRNKHAKVKLYLDADSTDINTGKINYAN